MDPREEQRIVNIKNAYSDQLLGLENVHTVAIGPKMVQGNPTGELSIVIFTTDKKPLSELPIHQRIPSHLHGYPVDVIESPRFVPYQDNEIPNRERLRPIPGGAEIYMPTSPFTGGVCTLGMYARSTRPQDSPDDIYLLANAHCFYRPDQVIYQPETDNSVDRIAYASRIVNSALVDGGIAQMIDPNQADTSTILGIGTPTGIYEVSTQNIGQQVIKSGRTTGVTIGFLTYLHADADDKKDQIIIVNGEDGPFSDHGDSGSIVLMYQGEENNKVIGLLWGGALIYTVICPIQPVLTELEIELIL